MAGRFIDEAAVRALPKGSEVVLGPGDLATPSALDLAFARGITVRRSDQAATADTPRRGGLWDRLLSRDGTYVVEVKSGRAQVHRLTESGPVVVKGD